MKAHTPRRVPSCKWGNRDPTIPFISLMNGRAGTIRFGSVLAQNQTEPKASNFLKLKPKTNRTKELNQTKPNSVKTNWMPTPNLNGVPWPSAKAYEGQL